MPPPPVTGCGGHAWVPQGFQSAADTTPNDNPADETTRARRSSLNFEDISISPPKDLRSITQRGRNENPAVREFGGWELLRSGQMQTPFLPPNCGVCRPLAVLFLVKIIAADQCRRGFGIVFRHQHHGSLFGDLQLAAPHVVA
jgi:hypothetical protein